MRRSVALGRATAAVSVAALPVAAAPAGASAAPVDVGIDEAVAAINAACAASQPLAETGVQVSDSETTVAAFAKRALRKLGGTATWTLDPAPGVVLTDLIPSPGELIRRTLAALARKAARQPLPAATQKALRTRVRNAKAQQGLDPMIPFGSSATSSSVIVWQKDTTNGTVHAIRFSRIGDGTQVGYAMERVQDQMRQRELTEAVLP